MAGGTPSRKQRNGDRDEVSAKVTDSANGHGKLGGAQKDLTGKVTDRARHNDFNNRQQGSDASASEEGERGHGASFVFSQLQG